MQDKSPEAPNPKDLVGITKPQLNLVPSAAKLYMALAMANGAKKYGPWNWREKKIQASIYVAAAQRHLDQWYDGEDNADDSGMPHLGHLLACVAILVDAIENNCLIDDRPLSQVASKLIKRYTK